MNFFRVTVPLCGEFIGHRWIPRTKAIDAELCFGGGWWEYEYLDVVDSLYCFRDKNILGKKDWYLGDYIPISPH